MIEKIARALAGTPGDVPDCHRKDARAALEAMLEPSEGMLCAAMQGRDSELSPGVIRSVHTAMIRHALENEK